MSTYSRTYSRLSRVTRKKPCPICGKPDWCGIGQGFVVCMRIQSTRPTSNRGWLHKLDSIEGGAR